jgi:hypothetical protein
MEIALTRKVTWTVATLLDEALGCEVGEVPAGIACMPCRESIFFEVEEFEDEVVPFLERHRPHGDMMLVVELEDGSVVTHSKLQRLN